MTNTNTNTNTETHSDNVKSITMSAEYVNKIRIIDFQSVLGNDELPEHLSYLIDISKDLLIDYIEHYLDDKNFANIKDENYIHTLPYIDSSNTELPDISSFVYSLQYIDTFNKFKNFTSKVSNNVNNSVNLFSESLSSETEDEHPCYISKDEIAKIFTTRFSYNRKKFYRTAIIPNGLMVAYILPVNISVNGYMNKNSGSSFVDHN